MKESESGRMRGVYGPILRLLSVDKEYAVAIETALGNAAQNVVVDTEADAKRAINYLKTNNGGRATFMPVSSTTSREFKENCFDKSIKLKDSVILLFIYIIKL